MALKRSSTDVDGVTSGEKLLDLADRDALLLALCAIPHIPIESGDGIQHVEGLYANVYTGPSFSRTR
jgi:hypothetical protein